MITVFETGIFEDGVFDGESGSVTITPTDKIVSIQRSFVLDSIDITQYVLNTSITKEVNRAYHVLEMSISGYLLPSNILRNKDKRLVVTIAEDVYSFILLEAISNYKNEYNISAKTQGCLLDFPFSPDSDGVYVGTANEIMNSFDNIQVNTPDFTFNRGSFISSGTDLEAIITLADVTGANFYDVDGTLIIDKHLRILENAVPNFIINKDIMTDYNITDNFDGSPLVTQINFNPSLDIIYSEPKITAVQDETRLDSKPYFLFNPTPASLSQITSNINPTALMDIIETFEDFVSSSRTVIVDGNIKTITAVILDGVTVPETDYIFEVGHNVILFNVEILGSVKVIYTTVSIKTYTRYGTRKSGTTTYLMTVAYLNQYLEYEYTLNQTTTGTTSSSEQTFEDLNGCVVQFKQGATKDTQLEFFVSGDITRVVFVADNNTSTAKIQNPFLSHPLYDKMYSAGTFDSSFVTGITKVDSTITVSGNATIVEISEADRNSTMRTVGIIVNKDIILSDFKVGSRTIALERRPNNHPFTKDYEVYMIADTSLLGKTCTFLKTVSGVTYTIPAVGLSPINAIDIYSSCDGITSFSYPDKEKTIVDDNGDEIVQIESFNLPQDITIDVAKLFGVSASSIVGKTIVGYGNTYIIDAYGKITVTVVTAEYITFDASSIKTGAEIYLDARCGIV